MTRYEKLFEDLGLKADEGYTNAEEYAKNFKRCTLLTDDSVSYSNSTGGADFSIGVVAPVPSTLDLQ